jgi:hypothetical protein
MKVLQGYHDLSKRSRRALAWDVFMVWVALVNLSLILFDLSYLWLRPTYFRYLRVVTRIYDPVKGISPHPLTRSLLDEMETTKAALQRELDSPEVPGRVASLRELTLRVFRENPFERSGLSEQFGLLKQRLADATGVPRAELENAQTLEQAVVALWPTDPEELRYRLDQRDPQLRRALELNYHRSYDLSGRLTDHFWLIDLPFLTLFWIEFLARWYLALRRRTHAKWFFFPIFNWYDLLGLIPVGYFRIFRLLRAVSMYMRLRRSELSSVGQDVVSRAVAYVSNIITEEVSDRVALRILSELHDEIADGTHTRIVRATVEPRLAEVREVMAGQIRQVLTDPATLANLRSLLQLNLDAAVDESEALRAVPMPGVVLRPLVRATGGVILDAAIEAISATLESEEGERALEEVAASIVDAVAYGPVLAQIEALTKDVTLQVIDRMKEVVTVKKWALPPTEARSTNPTAS